MAIFICVFLKIESRMDSVTREGRAGVMARRQVHARLYFLRR
jgi:hypothetical protein